MATLAKFLIKPPKGFACISALSTVHFLFDENFYSTLIWPGKSGDIYFA
jgi:hypothetical protein